MNGRWRAGALAVKTRVLGFLILVQPFLSIRPGRRRLFSADHGLSKLFSLAVYNL